MAGDGTRPADAQTSAAAGQGGGQDGDEGGGQDGGAEDPRLEPSEPFATTTVTLVAPDGAQLVVPVYDADTPEERARGLMFRDALPRGTGMVFRFPLTSEGGFWMRNTLIPLSIAYAAPDGRLVAVLDMEPCPADPCPTYEPGAAYLTALEVPQGWFREVGVDVGWRIELPDGLPPPT